MLRTDLFTRPLVFRLRVYCLGLGILFASKGFALTLGGSVTASTDYVYRGISHSRNESVVQVDLHLQGDSHWVIGAWGSSVQPLQSQHATEVDLYAQWQQPLRDGINAAMGLTYYRIVHDPRVATYNYLELNASLNWRDRVMLMASFAPNVSLFSRATGPLTGRETYSVELSGNQALPGKLMLQAGAGYFAAVNLPYSGYSFGSSSLSRRFGSVDVALQHFWVQDVSHRRYMAGPAGRPWALTATWNF